MDNTWVLENEQNEIQLVVFEVGSTEFAIPISLVREIINETKITSLPQMPASVIGIISLRGVIIPVLDLARRLKITLQIEEVGRSRKILIAEIEGKMIGCLVSEVSEVLAVSRRVLSRPDALQQIGAQTNLVSHICMIEERLFPVLDISRLLDPCEQATLDDIVDRVS